MSDERLFPDDIILQLQKFTHTTWGNSKNVLLTDPATFSDVEYIDLGEYFKAFRRLFPTAVRLYDKILVRQEYRDALQALKEDMMYSQGAYITGQPGIGKTLFLIYMLVISLNEKRPVLLQFPDGRPFYALFQDSVTFHSFRNGLTPIDGLCDFMWALSDSNYEVKCPNPIFLSEPKKIRVIQTTSPREDRWKGWSKEANTSCYVMDIWTAEEVGILSNLLSLDTERMKSLGAKWGCNPRQLLGFIETSKTDLQIEEIYKSQAPMAIERSKDMVWAIKRNALFSDGLSNFYFCRPKCVSETEFNRTIPIAIVPTKTICAILGDALQEHDNVVRLTFFRALSQHDETRAAAGYIYEHWFHVYFAAGEAMRCHWLQPKFLWFANSSVIQLIDKSNFIPSTLSTLTRDAAFFWVAPKGTAGVDSALVLEDAIYVFQVTMSPRHVSPINGMKKVRMNLPRKLQNVAWKVVFVGPEHATAKAVAETWADKLFFPTTGTKVSVAWAEVDPVIKGAHFMDFHDDEDLEVEFDDGEGVEPAVQEASSKGKKRAIEDVAEPGEAPRASTSRTRSGTRRKT